MHVPAGIKSEAGPFEIESRNAVISHCFRPSPAGIRVPLIFWEFTRGGPDSPLFKIYCYCTASEVE